MCPACGLTHVPGGTRPGSLMCVLKRKEWLPRRAPKESQTEWSALRQPLQHLQCVTESPTPRREPIRHIIRSQRLEPECLCAPGTRVLGKVTNHMLLEDLLRDYPAVCVERTDPETDGNVVLLVSKLLKRVTPLCPPGRKLDLRPKPSNHPVAFTIRRPHDVQTAGSTPTGNQLLSDLAPLPGGPGPDPGERTALPRQILYYVVGLQGGGQRGQRLHLWISHRPAHPHLTEEWLGRGLHLPDRN